MMSVLEWKLFDFIKLLPIKTPSKYKNLQNNRRNNTDGTVAITTATITTTCYNDVYQVLCDAQGAINIYSNEWDFTFYQMKGRPIQLSAITDSNVLVALEQDPVNYNLELRLYNLNKMMKRHQVVVLSKVNLECSCEANVMDAIFIDSTTSTAASASASAPASASSLIIIAIGLSNGYILLYKGPMTRDLGINFRHIYVCTKAIKGIKFVCHKIPGTIDYPKMFICTDNTVACFTLSAANNSNSSNSIGVNIAIGIGGITSGNSSVGGGGSNAAAAIAETKIVLDNTLGPVYCCTTYRFGDGDNDYYFIVGRDDALYCYTADGRGPCFAIEGRKQLLEWYDNGKHLICILSMDNHHQYQYQQSNEYHSENGENRENIIIIIDIENKLIMLNEKLDDDILCILPIDDSHTNCYIILKNLQFLTLRERSIQSKLHLLYNKNLYDIALKIICAANGNGSVQSHSNYLATTYAKYGDYMLQRGDYKTAIKLYIQSINGYSVSDLSSSMADISASATESSSSPFSIIMKLMNLNQKDYLIEYLKALINSSHQPSSQQQQEATVRHMELLRNCLKRQQISRKIDEIFDYIHNKVQTIKTDESDKNSNNEEVNNRSNDDFNYYPIELINFQHDDTTNKTIYKVLLNLSSSTIDKSQLSELFYKKSKKDVINFLQKYGTIIMLKYPQELCEALYYGCVSDGGKLDDASFRQCILPILLNDRKICVRQFSKFKQYFDCSSTAAQLYNIWLECILVEWQQQHKQQQQLTEIHLEEAKKGEKTKEDGHELRNRHEEIHIDTKYVLDFLKLHRNCFYDNDILIICRLYDFWPGIIWTFMNMKNGPGNLMKMYYLFKNYKEIFSNQKYFNANDFLDCRDDNGDDNDILLPLSLHALSKERDIFQKSSQLIQFILTAMFSNNNIVSNSLANMAPVKYPEFMLKTLQNLFSIEHLQMSHIVEHLNKQKLFALLLNRNIKDDIAELNQQLNEHYQLLLNYQKRPIEYRGDLCELCKQPIKLPATFYLCQHSYHQECYSAHIKGGIGGGGGENNIKQKCVKCQRQRELNLLNKHNDNVDNDKKVFNNIPIYSDILKRSANSLSNGIFYKLNGEVMKSTFNRISEKNTNPFVDDE